MSPRLSSGERRLVARHEAGHAVVAVVPGWPIRYATINPRTPGAAGLVMPARSARRLLVAGRWEPELLVTAAGMAAEDLLYGGDAASRRRIVRRNQPDMRDLRYCSRHVWHHLQDGCITSAGTVVDAGWTVADIATYVWRRAVQLVWDHLDALVEVAEALEHSPRALTQAEIARLVAATRPLPEGVLSGVLTEAELEFWPARYSRLAWRPATRCDSASNAA